MEEEKTGHADPRVVNQVEQKPVELMSEAGKANATHAGAQVDWKSSIGGEKK
jgi:hypothetical protein